MAQLSSDVFFHEVPLARAQADGDAVAIVHEGVAITCREFARQCDAMAAGLWHEWGVRAGDRIAWLGANHPAQIALLFALARIGAILLPLNTRLAPLEWRALIDDCSPRFLVHDAAFADAAHALDGHCGIAARSLDELHRFDTRHAAPVMGLPSSPVLLVYTSGTTSRAKAAVHTQANLLANMQIASQVQEITRRDVVATMLPLFHVGGLCIQTLPALFAGAKVILHSRFTPDAALACFERDRPTLTLQVPATMRAMIEHPHWHDADLSGLRALWAGSSVLPRDLVDAFHARGVAVCNVYGSTETGPFSIALPARFARSHAGSCGWPAPGVDVMLHEASKGVGELWVRGPNVVQRYWPDQSACDSDGWFHTGDLANRADDGSYTIAGRLKDLIISGGENIHPAQIEALLASHPCVAECAAFALPDETWGEIVAVAVVAKPGQTIAEQELRDWTQGKLARFKLPRRWFFVAALPKTALGKVQRAELACLASS
ncbi:class I adenylate-forming enzyme family protein [Caenimonas sp. SL110]|uniref:class I adenylate-forming enzyme family protein n=1 Tax=Caenimonas sp. SL110 TaxID=1450524 RepID=UPI00069FDAE8|nr:AMP-binding protein [Caenimonas sp. SL110]